MQGARFGHGMLSRRQAWRRQSGSDRRRAHDFLFEQGIEIESSTATRRAWSDEGIFHEPPHVDGNSTRRWSTTGDLQAPRTDMNGKRIKSVAFSDRVFVILIPNIAEYENVGLSEQLWWHEDDYRVFKTEALEELKNFMQTNRIRDSKLAIQQLYFNNIPEIIPVNFNHQDSFQIPHGGLLHNQRQPCIPAKEFCVDNDDASIDEKTTTASSSSESLSTMDQPQQPSISTSISSSSIHENQQLHAPARKSMRQSSVASVSPIFDSLVLPTMQGIDGLSINPNTLQNTVTDSRFSALLCL